MLTWNITLFERCLLSEEHGPVSDNRSAAGDLKDLTSKEDSGMTCAAMIIAQTKKKNSVKDHIAFYRGWWQNEWQFATAEGHLSQEK